MSIFPEQVLALTESKLGYEFKDKTLLASALNASGNTHLLHGARVSTNKRLSLYGDVTMTALFCNKWYAAGLAQSDWAEIRSTVLGIKNLGRVGEEAGLAEAVVRQGGTAGVSVGMMAAVVQALMGAVHLDAGTEANQRMEATMAKIGITSALLSNTAGVVGMEGAASAVAPGMGASQVVSGVKGEGEDA